MISIPGIMERRGGRRQFLAVSALSAAAAMLNRSELHAEQTDVRPSIESCILVMLYGGPSQLDTWDMKPRAPVEIRGEFRAISTRVPGLAICEHLSMCGDVMDRLAIVRSMHHRMANHNSAMYQALVGRAPRIDLDVLGPERSADFPNVGSTLSYLVAANSAGLKPKQPLVHVALPHVMHNVVDLPGQNAGFLGGRFDPFQVTHDPNRADFQVPNLNLPGELTEGRVDRRLELLDDLEAEPKVVSADSWREYHGRAVELLRSRQIHRAFRVSDEPSALRDRYGRSTLGQSMLLARKLAENGVRFINVNDHIYNGQDANWDSHEKIFPRHRQLLEPLDRALSALIEDLAARGMLESTLVVVMGEFGRTPRVNANGGRDHWPDCYSLVMAGGGCRGGAVLGASDRYGAYPVECPVTPGDVVATILWRFGVDPRQELFDTLGRPLPLAIGTPLQSLF